MKNLITVLIAAMLFMACSKQASDKLAPSQQSSKSKAVGKGKNKGVEFALSLIANDTIRNDAQALVVANAFDITNPSVGEIAFDNPPVEAGDEWRWTGISYGSKPDDTTFIKVDGFLINQTTNPVNPFINGSGQVGYTVPSGTWAIRIEHVVFKADGRVAEYHSFVRDGFQF